MDMSGILKNIVPITLFNKGKASQLFAKAQSGKTLVVVKNNVPVAIIVSPYEYELLRELSNTCRKAVENDSIGKGLGRIEAVVSKINLFDENGEKT